MEIKSIELEIEELDLPPEYCHYCDDGCVAADQFFGHKSSCLDCPFPKCIYDEPRGQQRWLKRQRDRKIVRQFIQEGKEVGELARIFGLSPRTIQRALKGFKDE